MFTACGAQAAPRGVVVVGTVPHTFQHPDHGLVGLHIMFQQFNDPVATAG